MARPKKADDAKRECIVTLRCTEAERAALQSKAAAVSMTQGAYLREMAISGRVVVKQTTAPDFELVNQMRKIGVNLNQIAKVANATGAMPATLSHTLTEVETALFRLLKASGVE
jgi:hypothetical protein